MLRHGPEKLFHIQKIFAADNLSALQANAGQPGLCPAAERKKKALDQLIALSKMLDIVGNRFVEKNDQIDQSEMTLIAGVHNFPDMRLQPPAQIKNLLKVPGGLNKDDLTFFVLIDDILLSDQCSSYHLRVMG